ncbi:MAG: alginate export family protein [Halioglobus sp.]
MTASLKALRLAAVAVAVLSVAPTFAQESEATDFTSMLTEGKASFDFRYRYEFVDDENFSKDAKASTLRSRLTFASAAYRGFSFLTEFDDVSTIGSDNYNSTANGNGEYPTVADPEGTEVNQAWIKYTVDSLSGSYGRQRILHGGQRFVGGVAWRQNEQTYDGFRALYKGGSSLTLDYAYVYNVNRIFGPDDSTAQPADWGGENHLARADFKFAENHTLSAFAYALDIDERSGWPADKSVDNSTDAYGVEYSVKIGPVTAKATYANQSESGDSNLDYNASYYMVEGGLTVLGVKAILGYEVLGGDNGVGFKTPLATLHKFQGWADKFLTTPGDGIEDLYVGAKGELGPVQLGAYYHDFQAEDSNADFGTEIDLVASWPATKNLKLELNYASFSTDNKVRYSDTDKTWLTVIFKI